MKLNIEVLLHTSKKVLLKLEKTSKTKLLQKKILERIQTNQK